MNKWTAKSIRFAAKAGYLDKLHRVYPVKLLPPRKLEVNVRRRLKKAFESKDRLELVALLLEQDKFPIKDPYVAYLRREKGAVQKNKATVKRITDTIFDMGFDRMINGITEPKEVNRRMGTLFRDWFRAVGYPLLEETAFTAHKGTAILKGSDRLLLSFATRKLRCRLEKAPDFIVKNRGLYFIGEAKFLTDTGGHQGRQLDDALALVNNRRGKARKVAVLDGIVWSSAGGGMRRKIEEAGKDIFTALILKEYINSFN